MGSFMPHTRFQLNFAVLERHTLKRKGLRIKRSPRKLGPAIQSAFIQHFISKSEKRSRGEMKSAKAAPLFHAPHFLTQGLNKLTRHQITSFRLLKMKLA